MAASKSPYKLTEKALEKLLGAACDELTTDDPHDSILLQICCSASSSNTNDHNDSSSSSYNNYLAVDGSGNACRVRLLESSSNVLQVDAKNDLPYSIILVRGVVVSTVNAGLSEPLLYITAFDIVEQRRRSEPLMQLPSTDNDNNNIRLLKLPLNKTMGGNAHDFFAGMSHFLSNADLAGCCSRNNNVNATLPADWTEKEAVVSHFLEHDKAIKTISRTSSSSSPHGWTDHHHPTNQSSSDCYLTTQTEFMASQLDRQKASLTSNTGHQDAQTSVKTADQHARCLTTALDNDQDVDLTPELLCQWHGILCGNGLHRHAGILRPKGVQVRVGQMSFRPSTDIPDNLNTLCRALMTLETRLLRNGNSSLSSSSPRECNAISPSIAAITFAAAVFFGIVDTHAFADGNGRLARIAANWALRRAGLPFCVHFFATTAQRKEYRDATIMTRRNLYLVPRGHVPQETLLDAFRGATCLQPLVVLFMDRVYKAVTEFTTLVKEKTAVLTDHDEARAARMFRERAAAGNCFICFEDNPNIATLCCGKAVHLNCMAEWLSSKNSCPQCRGDLPSLSQRLRPSPGEDDDLETSDDSFETTDTTSFSDDEGDAGDPTMDDDTTSSTTVTIAPPLVHVPPAAVANDDTTIDDDETTATDDGGDTPMADASVTDDTTTDETEVAAPSVSDLPPYCSHGHCQNRSARDCANACCGRCCVLQGHFSCSRHNVS